MPRLWSATGGRGNYKMLYWLFTGGRGLLGSLLIPLVPLGLILPLGLCVALGRGIQRTGTDARIGARGGRWLLLMVTFGVVNLATFSAYAVLLGPLAVTTRRGAENTTPLILALTGGPVWVDHNHLFSMAAAGLGLCAFASMALAKGVQNGGWLRERIDRLRRPPVQRGAMGSAHFCTPREYQRFRRPDSDGIILYGAFWGINRLRLDAGIGRLCLSGEDAARGILTLGGPGAGKTQAVILPVIADHMLGGHSLIIA